MKKLSMILLSLFLCVTMAALAPAQVIAASNSGALYLSDVKVGMGATSEEAAAELIAEGYTILTEDGEYADLNEDAGTNSGMKKGPTDKVVYIGYKTTANPKEAITDLAVMNMNGGYSTEDYEVLMNNHMEGEIKPFVNRFIDALNEYRENYKKPADTFGHKRADYYRRMLNKLTDDDTGDKPLGDLLLNETKYEMGDEKYNALSDAEKKNHADILTLLMQGNGRAVLLLETLITKAADSADDTWLDRFLNTTTEKLTEQIKKNNPGLTTEADVIAELDKTYNDTAKIILEKWDAFREIIVQYDDTVNELDNKDPIDAESILEKAEKLDTNNLTTEGVDTVVEAAEASADMTTTIIKGEQAAIVEFLDVTETEDGTLLEFFDRDKSELSGENIRELYPIAAALSPGQIAGLDFLSITDLFSIAITNETGFNTTAIPECDVASVYQDVDRAIYEHGGVALTNKALRDNANTRDDDSSFMLSPLGFVCWGLTATTGAAAITSLVLRSGYLNKIAEWSSKAQPALEQAKDYGAKYIEALVEESSFSNSSAQYWFTRQNQKLADYVEAFDKAAEYTTKSNITKYLAIGFSVIAALLAAWSIYTTVSEMLEYYKVTFIPIPKYMVEEMDITETVDGKTVMKKNETAYYKVARCNRKEGDSDIEKENYQILGASNDLNGDVGKQWLALYYVKYNEGRPILADSLKVVKGNSALPNGYETGIHRFGESAAFNLTHKYYCYNDGPDGTFVYFKNDTKTMNQLLGVDSSSTGSLFSGGSLAIGAGIGMILGGGIVALIMTATNKKRKVTAAA